MSDENLGLQPGDVVLATSRKAVLVQRGKGRLHRSGECLCGAFAHPDEIHAIELFYPEDAAYIHDIEAMCVEAGLVDCRWAAPSKAPGKTWDDLADETGQDTLFPLCTDCAHREAATV